MNFNEIFRPRLRFNFSKRRLERFRFWSIMMLNYCNISCESCAFMCDREWDSGNKKIEPRTIIDFCENMFGIGLETPFIITGGEPTLIMEELKKVIRILNRYNRKIILETNGFDILSLDIQTLNMIDRIHLDDKGIYRRFQQIYWELFNKFEGEIELRKTHYHFNIYEAKRHKANQGRKCPRFMRSPSIWNGLIYPCCILPTLSNPEIDDLLREQGFHCSDTDLIYNLKHWRELLPYSIHRECEYNCHRPKPDKGSRLRITRKSSDRWMIKE